MLGVSEINGIEIIQQAPVVDIDHLRELLGLYEDPLRFYHNWHRIHGLLSLANDLKSRIVDFPTMVVAILYHDAVYDTMRPGNERESAALMRARMAPVAPPALVDHAEIFILATERHLMPRMNGRATLNDAALFLDMGMAVMGAPDDEFAAYSIALRKEYGHVPDELYRRARTLLLQNLLNRPQIYFTKFFNHRLEAQARQNIARSIRSLQSNEPLVPLEDAEAD